MTRAALLACVAASLAAGPADAAPARPADPARLQVVAREFSFGLSRLRLPAGPAIVELVNLGEDDHDLALRRLAKGAVTRRIRVVHPGGLGELEARLPAGRYRLWCTLADHRARGMVAALVVRPRRT